jgi:PAS domain S-box-containing protein
MKPGPWNWLARLFDRSGGVRLELEEANQRAAQLLESINDSFFSVDREWRFTYANRRFRGYARGSEEMSGRVLWEDYPELLGTEMEQRYRQAMEDGQAAHFEALSKLSDRWFLIHAYPSPTGLSVFATDISDRKRAEQAAEEARAQAELANRMKDQFLATLSHELRTPLNAIVGWVQLLRSGRLETAAVERGLEAIERNTRIQARLIEDLLDISRIISGKLRLEPRPVEPVEVVEAALAAVAPAAEAKGLRVERRVDPAAGPVLGDPGRLQQVVSNLLSNAVKFTPAGGTIEVRVEPAGSRVEIAVADTGEGIRPEFLPYVFDSFRQADASTTRRQGGLGLGLSIVRNLVELHGGTVRVESPGHGQGATFTVSLLAAPDDGDREAQAGAAGQAGGVEPPARGTDPAVRLTGLRVLVVDDEADARELLERVFQDAGAEVALAGSVREALEAFESSAPGVLVSDIGMPDQDGYDLIRRLRERGLSSGDLPAVALTAFARAEDRERALSEGFQVHIAKPVDPRELTAIVARLAGFR